MRIHCLRTDKDVGQRYLTSQQGYTLIELLIVILIISIVASVAVLTIRFNSDKNVETLGKQLTNVLTLAGQEALLRSTTLGFAINKNTYQFYEYIPPKKPDENPWKPLTDNILGHHSISKDILLTLKVENKTVPQGSIKLIFSPSGEITPFTLTIGNINSTPRYKLTGEANGQIKQGWVDEEK